MRSDRFPSRGVLVARAWQALCRGPFFIAGWFFLVPAVAIAALTLLSVILLLITMVFTGEWDGLRVLAGMFVSGSLQVLGLAGLLLVTLVVNDRIIYLARPAWPRDPRQATRRRSVDVAKMGRRR